MPVYIVTPKAGGEPVYRYHADAPVDWPAYPLAAFDHVEATAAPPPPPPPPVPPVRLSRLAFRNRFTATEKATIEFAAADNPAAPTPQRQQAAALRANLADQRDAEFIDLTRADTRTGVLTLEAMGLIGPGRALVILDTPPSPTEVWNG